MRVLQINDYREGGGAEVLVAATVRLLRERGHEVDLFTAEDVPGGRSPLSYIDSRRGRKALRRRLDAFAPDVVHLHNFYHELSPGILQTIRAWRAAGRHARPPARILMTAHDFHLACPNAGMNWFLGDGVFRADAQRLGETAYLMARRWDRRGFAYSALKLLQHIWSYRVHRRQALIDRIICPSRTMQHVLDPLGMPTALLHNPAPAPLERPRRAGQPLTFVFVGRVEPEKGLDRFLELLPRDFPARLEVIGDGAGVERCRAISVRRGFSDRVRFAGRLPHDEVMRAVAAAHVLVLPSRLPENGPLVLLEALACGTNLLVSGPGGAAEIVADAGVGFVFDPETGDGLHEALQVIAARFAAGRLNDFDAGVFLRARGERAYIEGLESIYNGAERPTSWCASPPRI